MLRPFYLLIFFMLTGFVCYGQDMPCEKLIKLMQADNAKQTYWDSTDYTLDKFYCAGSYFAQQDIDKGIYLIHTYNNPDWDHPCKVCKYNSYGFSFKYHKSNQWDTKTSFIEGYNEIAEAYLRSKMSDTTFTHLNDVSPDYFNPGEILNKNFDKGNYRKLLELEIVNDTTINVKLQVGKIFTDFPQFTDKIRYHISAYNPADRTSEPEQVLNNKQIAENGFELVKKANDSYYFKIVFDFKNVPTELKYCRCPKLTDKEYSYIIPLIIK